jgi:hypothetical protein
VTLVVDTYNVLHVTGVLPPELAGLEVAGLAALIALSRYAKAAAWLVCDGVGPPLSTRDGGRILTKYAGHGRSADDEIERLIERSSAPRRMTVVSSDHRVRQAARRRRCRWLRSEEFLEHLAADVQRGRGQGPRRALTLDRSALPLHRDEVQRWVERFGLDAHLLGVPASAPIGSAAPAASAPEVRGAKPPGAEMSAESRESAPVVQQVDSPRAAAAPAPVQKGPVQPAPVPPAPVPPAPVQPALTLSTLESIDFEAIMRAALEALPEGPRPGETARQSRAARRSRGGNRF